MFVSSLQRIPTLNHLYWAFYIFIFATKDRETTTLSEHRKKARKLNTCVTLETVNVPWNNFFLNQSFGQGHRKQCPFLEDKLSKFSYTAV